MHVLDNNLRGSVFLHLDKILQIRTLLRFHFSNCAYQALLFHACQIEEIFHMCSNTEKKSIIFAEAMSV